MSFLIFLPDLVVRIQNKLILHAFKCPFVGEFHYTIDFIRGLEWVIDKVLGLGHQYEAEKLNANL